MSTNTQLVTVSTETHEYLKTLASRHGVTILAVADFLIASAAGKGELADADLELPAPRALQRRTLARMGSERSRGGSRSGSRAIGRPKGSKNKTRPTPAKLEGDPSVPATPTPQEIRERLEAEKAERQDRRAAG